MTELSVSRADLESFTQILAGIDDLAEAPKALLTQLVADIAVAMGELDEAGITVVPAPETVEPISLIGEQFETAFTAEAADAPGGHGVEIRLHKVHR